MNLTTSIMDKKGSYLYCECEQQGTFHTSKHHFDFAHLDEKRVNYFRYH